MGKKLATLGLGISLLAPHGAFSTDAKSSIVGVEDDTRTDVFKDLSEKKDDGKTAFVSVEKRKKATINYEPSDSIDHQTFIAMDMGQIIAKYGQVKWLELIREHFLMEINTIRGTNNLWTLSEDSSLQKAAQSHASYVFDHQHDYDRMGQDTTRIPHFSYDAQGKVTSTPGQRADEQGYNYLLIKENISKNGNLRTQWLGSIQTVIDERKKSSHGHRWNLLSQTTDIGIWYIHGIVVILFGNH